MKLIFSLLSVLLPVCWASAKETTYTGSTPAGPLIRPFLGIPMSDSVDFVRWKFIVGDHRYLLQCVYGISQANTNGFISGGTKVELSGRVSREKNQYLFQNGAKNLKALELNADLLHLLNADNSLLVGNGGWSYTLNNLIPSAVDELGVSPAPTVLRDSMRFQGRTPCKVPGVVGPGSLCYKLKWSIVLYADARMNTPGRYKVLGTPWREEGARTGTWKIIAGKTGRAIYQLNDEEGNGFLYLLKLDDHILLFTNAQGHPLVGDEDFSYTLNSMW